MPRYRLTVEYDGGPYCGFQAQAKLPTVQAALERAILAFCGERLRVHAAGRTDTGVHATGQVIHIDLEKAWPAETVRNAINAHLRPEPIVVLDAAEAPAGSRGSGSHSGSADPPPRTAHASPPEPRRRPAPRSARAAGAR